ncbi:AAA family ATPase [Fusobacterium sp. THCT1E2]
MAQKVLILGSSGTGKSTSIRNLNPDETFIIKAVEKQLPFKKSETLYNSENKNIFTTQKINSVLSMLDRIEKNSKVKTLIIDDFNYLLTFGYKEKAVEKGYQKFETLAFGIIDIFSKIDTMRNDLIVYVMAHTQKDQDGKLSMKTIGKFLDDKVVIEGLFSMVILALGSEGDYKFKVNGIDPAKTPIEMFETDEIENDLTLINKAIKEYFN